MTRLNAGSLATSTVRICRSPCANGRRVHRITLLGSGSPDATPCGKRSRRSLHWVREARAGRAKASDAPIAAATWIKCRRLSMIDPPAALFLAGRHCAFGETARFQSDGRPGISTNAPLSQQITLSSDNWEQPARLISLRVRFPEESPAKGVALSRGGEKTGGSPRPAPDARGLSSRAAERSAAIARQSPAVRRDSE